MIRRPPRSTLFPTRRSSDLPIFTVWLVSMKRMSERFSLVTSSAGIWPAEDRKSTRLNSSHQIISYAVFCLKKKKQKKIYHDYHIYRDKLHDCCKLCTLNCLR